MRLAGLAASLPLVLAAAAFAPGVAHADETPTAAVTASTRRVQVIGALDVTQNGLGLQAGLRYRHVEASLGTSYGVFNHVTFVGLKAFLFPDEALSPYAYARAGLWHEDGIEGRADQDGHSLAGGGGVELHMGRHAFGFAELGYAAETNHLGSLGQLETHTGSDVRVGFGFRF